MREDLTMIPTERLPPGLEHVKFPVERLEDFRLMRRLGTLTVHGSVVRCGGTIYTTVRRVDAPSLRRKPAPPRAAYVLAGLTVLAGLAGITALVAYLVRTMTSAVRESGPALGIVLAFALVLFVAVAVDRRRAR